MSWPRRWRKRLRALFRREEVERELDEELAYHLELETLKNLREGMTPEEARRQAAFALGGVEKFKEEVRDARWLGRLSGLSLDLKLGVRMLIKYPGLTVVGGIAMAFAILVGVTGYEVMSQLVRPTLPLHEGDRVVGIRLAGGMPPGDERRDFYDLVLRGDAMRSVEDIGAFRTVQRNLIVDGDWADLVDVAQITASGFRLARVSPLLGRPLDASDEAPGAPAVFVIGYDEWRDRFDGRLDVIGETVRFGRDQATIVGVMPEGFAFPVADGFWTPLRRGGLAYDSSSSVAGLQLFGRLAPGYGYDEARAEVALVADRVSAESPPANRALVAELLPYPRMINNVTGWEATVMLLAVNLFLIMLLILACGNVALLMFARAATRENELAVRSALGASRARITIQLFFEALLLGGIAAAAGLVTSGAALRSTLRMMSADSGGILPFWFDARLSGEALLYAVVLTVLAAATAGVLPALKVTGRDVVGRLRKASGGGGRYQLRGIWTAVIVAQVGTTLAFPALAFFGYRYVSQIRQMEVGFASDEFLAARLELDPEPTFGADSIPAERRREISAIAEELKRRLSAEPGVAGVTFASRLPRTLRQAVRIEVDGVEPPEDGIGMRVGRAAVDLDFFNVLEAPIVAGRAFGPADVEASESPIIVNRAFVDHILKGRSPIGRRVRTLTWHYDESVSAVVERSEWHEIVGLVKDLGMLHVRGSDPIAGPGFYQPASPGELMPPRLAVHVTGDRRPESFAPRLRAIASTIDPALRLEDVVPLDEAGAHMWLEAQFFSRLLVLASGIALLLSLAAIYSVTAFAVARRTREIGIRAALGAGRRRILAAIFVRPLVQVGLGVAAGTVLVGWMTSGVLSGSITARQIGLIALYAVVMLAVCALACVVPTRRALRVEPTEAMRADM